MENEREVEGTRKHDDHAEILQRSAKREELERIEKEALERARAEYLYSLNNGQMYSAFQREYRQNPREYLHNFLLQAKQVGCTVDTYIDAEIKKMLNELER